MPDTESEPGPRPRRFRGSPLYSVLRTFVLVSLILTPFVALVVTHLGVEKALRDAVSEADRLDPGWRLEALQANRESIPDESNGANRVAAVVKDLPEDWKKWPVGPTPADWTQLRGLALHQVLKTDHPNVLLSEQRASALEAESRRVEPAIQLARALIGYPKGRYTIVYKASPVTTSLSRLEETRTVARLLEFDVVARGQTGDVDGALRSCRALLNTARSIGDEPNIIAQLIRIAIRSVSALSVERALALGEPSDSVLSSMQDDLLRELAEPVGLHALRGERAHTFYMFDELQKGKVTLQQLAGEPPDEAQTALSRFARVGSLFYTNNQATALKYLNQAVEISKKPAPEQGTHWVKWRANTSMNNKSTIEKISSAMALLLLAPLEVTAKADSRTKANLGTCVALVAVERFHRSQGRWPISLAEVQETLAITLPLDPYTAAPFHLKRTEDGVTVYSVSSDLTDNGGTLDNQHPDRVGVDLGYRLWDVSKRRLPSAP